MNDLNLIRQVCDVIVRIKKDDKILYSKYKQIQETLNDDQCFIKLSLETSIRILKDLGLNEKESFIMYANIVNDPIIKNQTNNIGHKKISA